MGNRGSLFLWDRFFNFYEIVGVMPCPFLWLMLFEPAG